MEHRWIYGLTALGCRFLPLRVLQAMSFVGFEIAFRAMKKTRAGVERNLETAFAPVPGELRRLSRKLFHAYGLTTVDLFRLLGGTEAVTPVVSTREIDAKVFRSLLRPDRGCLIASAHIGNWEMGALSLAAHHIRGAVIGQAELDPAVERLRETIRGRLGVELIPVGGTMATAFRVRAAIERGLPVAIAVDRAWPDDRVDVTFFGRPTPFLRSPARLARFCNCPILPAFFFRNPDGSYRSVFGEPLESDPSCGPDEDARRIMQAVATETEKALRQEPTQWFNFYDFWEDPAATAPPESRIA